MIFMATKPRSLLCWCTYSKESKLIKSVAASYAQVPLRDQHYRGMVVLANQINWNPLFGTLEKEMVNTEKKSLI